MGHLKDLFGISPPQPNFCSDCRHVFKEITTDKNSWQCRHPKAIIYDQISGEKNYSFCYLVKTKHCGLWEASYA